MARKLRVQYPGAIYQVMKRGDHWEVIFRDSKRPELFVATLAEACAKTARFCQEPGCVGPTPLQSCFDIEVL